VTGPADTGGSSLALVLGGGGIAGIAWHTGVLAGLLESGVDVTGADLLVGTSAGSTVVAQLGAGRTPAELFERQVDPATLATELDSGVPLDDLIARLAPIYGARIDAAERRRRLGAMALGTETVDEATRRAVIAARLADAGWTGRRVEVVAVDTHSGDRRIFDAGSGVDLVDAVAASCAVPGVWPPVTIDGSRYVDGGIWSYTNSDRAAGHDRVLVLAPLVDPALDEEIAGLPGTPRVEVVVPDEASTEAFGVDVLDLAVREPSARAGLLQGRAEADRVRKLLAD